MKRIIAAVLTLVLFGSLTACDVQNKKEEEVPAYPVRVANVTVQTQPEKVACLSPSLVEILFEHGYGDKVVIRTDDAGYPEQVKEIPSAGKTGHLDTSAIVAALPDVVLTHDSLSKKDMEALETAKIQVIVLPMAKNLEELKKLYQNIGLLFLGQKGGSQAGADQFAKIESGLNSIKAKLPAEAANSTFLYIINPSGIIATGDTFESSVLSVFGTNAAQDAVGYAVDAKEMQAKDPDFIFVADPYGLPHLQSNAGYKNFSAVKNGKVYTLDNTLFGLQSGRILDLVGKVAVALYPEVFDQSEGESSEQTASEPVASVASK
ncbi:MAG: ABC transporter substrate-binding protein [Clostridiales bacterium]|nr:ABC transporter substrate-binding protein [Clostridiales bacterium]